MKPRTSPVIAVIAIVAVIAVGAVIAVTGRHGTTALPPKAPAAMATGTSTPATPSTPAGLPAGTLTDMAVRFEHASRDWGADPDAVTADRLAQSDGQTLMNLIRTPDRIDRSPLDRVSGITIGTTGPDKPSPYCTRGYRAMCETYPTQYAYWRAQAWTMGARLQGDPAVTVTGPDTVTVTGTVKIVLWSDTQDAAATTGWWAYTPVTGTYAIRDELTFDDRGMVTKRVRKGPPTPWIGDPWYSTWETNPADATASWPEREQKSIPVKGMPPQLDLYHDPTLNVLRNGTSMDGPLWENVHVELPDTSCPDCAY